MLARYFIEFHSGMARASPNALIILLTSFPFYSPIAGTLYPSGDVKFSPWATKMHPLVSSQ